MPFAPLMFAAALALPVPSAPSDPAIAVCEMLVRQALRKPDSFALVAEPVVVADSVQVTYSSLDAHGRTVTDTRNCRFHLGGDGRFHIEAFRGDHLAARLAAARAKLGKVKTHNESMLVNSEIIDIGREMFVQHDRMKKAEHEASKAGIYPISPAGTALKE